MEWAFGFQDSGGQVRVLTRSSSSSSSTGGPLPHAADGERPPPPTRPPHSLRSARDPRFEDGGPLDADKFRKRYSFVYNEVLPLEKEELGKQLQVRGGVLNLEIIKPKCRKLYS